MKKYVVIADSTCDLNKELREKYDIDYVKMNYVLDDQEYPASLDWETHSVREFYDFMRNGKRITTTQVTRENFTEKFKFWLDKEYDIIYISCSSALSGSVGLAKVIAKELESEYEGAKIYCVDSLISSLGQAFLTMKASEMRAEGKTFEEVVTYLEDNKLKVNQFGTVDSMEYLKRAGRVKASKAFFGNLFGIKPIIISDKIGQNYAVKKVKGSLNAKKEIAALINEACEDDTCLYISHADCEEDALVLRDEILKIREFKDVCISTIGPIVGCSVGPGTLIAFCYGKEVTIEGRE